MRATPALLLAISLLLACGDSATVPDAGPGADAGVDAEAPDAAPPATCPEGYPLGDLYGKLLVDVTIDGHGPFQFIYDTGAPDSGMEESVAAIVGAGPHTVTVGGRDVPLEALRSFPAAAFGIPGLQGVLGYDVMGDFAVTIDTARMRFWLDDARDDAALLACDHVARDPADVPFVRSNYLFVHGRAEGIDGWFLVDTGATLGGMPDPIFDQLDRQSPRPTLDGFYTAAAIGTFWARLGAVGHLEVAGHRIEHILTRTTPPGLLPAPATFGDGLPFLGLLPSGFLSHFMITVDHPARTLRLDAYPALPPRGPDYAFPIGIGIGRSVDPPILVERVLPGSAAEEAGVVPGDEVLAIAGTSIETLTPSERPWALVSRAAGTLIEVRISHDGTERTLTLLTRDLLTDPPL